MLNDPPPHHWSAPDLDDAKLKRLQEIEHELSDLLPSPNLELDPATLTVEQAEMVRIYTRRLLMFHLLAQEYHMHEMDDCGDYLTAATDNWASLYSALWTNDFQDEVEETRKFLTDLDNYPPGGCDGEIRHALLREGWDEDA